MIMKPWNFKIHGAYIRLGDRVHIVAARGRPVRLTTWQYGPYQGHISLGHFSLVCPGTRIDSASEIEIGNNCMLASNVYITDADWHDIYDRTQPVGMSDPIKLADNVWLGDSSIVCKGVSIGENTVVGAGSVVTSSLPANVIAAGNPARIIKNLDPNRQLTRREDLLANHAGLEKNLTEIEVQLLGTNRWSNWLRSLLAPDRMH